MIICYDISLKKYTKSIEVISFKFGVKLLFLNFTNHLFLFYSHNMMFVVAENESTGSDLKLIIMY